jgi:HlyD family secretion protein/adhesin transport system membrane fusion protein
MQRAAQAVAREMAEITGRIAATRAGLAAGAARIREVLDDARARRGDELQPVLAELAVLDARLAALGKRLEARFLRAPLDGVVKTILARPGETVREGTPIVVVVPSASTLRFDMEIAARYGPLVREGQSARISIAGLDPYRHGYLVGTVRQVSAASFIEPQRPPVFRLSLDIDPTQGPVARLRPGLIGEGRIVLGERTGVDYLANSLVRVWGDALSEP